MRIRVQTNMEVHKETHKGSSPHLKQQFANRASLDGHTSLGQRDLDQSLSMRRLLPLQGLGFMGFRVQGFRVFGGLREFLII